VITNITQTKFHKHPTPDSHGNCQQAAMASLLGLQLDDVPDFFADGEHQFWPSVWRFTKASGLTYCTLRGVRYLPFYHLAYGPSSRGCEHAVVWYEGKLAWDPHPSREGLLSVSEFALLVPEYPRVQAASI
jgi:hypothetical protein